MGGRTEKKYKQLMTAVANATNGVFLEAEEKSEVIASSVDVRIYTLCAIC